ncbi:hypothetical protein H7F33_02245 [Pedobacter sp. PAMC26386]|nr:hypothetical protein H7F33_02245 [Pedobacter sp. PAMC26386]
MRRIILFLLLSISTFQLKSQIPQPGIYQFNNQQQNYFGGIHYARFFNAIDDFLSMQIVPYKEVADFHLKYAIVAVDKTNKQVKIAFLRDTVNAKTKMPGSPYFSQEFLINKDSVYVTSNYESALAGSGSLPGSWFFSKSGYDYFGIYKPPLVKTQSIKDTLSGNYKNGSNYQFEQAFFLWRGKMPKPYLDLRTNDHNDKVFIYDQPKPKAAVKDYFRKGETIVITSNDSQEWYGVDRIEVRKDNQKYYTMDYGMKEGTTFLQTTSGWIKKEDLAVSPWIKQKQQTKLYRFEISVEDEYLKAIKIINKKTGRQQVILDIWAELKSNPVNVIQVVDCNFDGYPDMTFLMQTGGAGPNYTDNFYLYNPITGNFDYNDELSQLSQIQINTKTKTIRSDWRDGAAHHGGEKYVFINQQLTKIADWDQQALTGYFAQESSGELVNGRWVEHNFKGAEVLFNAVPVYKNPDELKAPVDTVSKGSYALIKDENALFFYTEITTTANQFIKGWVKKENFLPQTKSRYTESTPLYDFELIKDNESNPVAIKINTKASGKTMQYLTEVDGVDSTNNTLYPDDYNFDGYPDFSLRTSSRDDAEAGNLYENYYLYDHAASLFKIDTTLSNLPNLEFDSKNKTFSTTRFTKKDSQIQKHIKIYKTQGDKYIIINETNKYEEHKKE